MNWQRPCAESPGSETPGDSGTPGALDDEELFIVEGSTQRNVPTAENSANKGFVEINVVVVVVVVVLLLLYG